MDIIDKIYIVSFNSTNHVIRCEKIFEKNNIKYMIIPTPREITKSCGMSIRFLIDELDNIKAIIDENQIEYKGIFEIIKSKDGKKEVKQIY